MNHDNVMGRVFEKVKIANFLDKSKSIEIEGLVDTGATMMVIPESIAKQLGLKKVRKVQVTYADDSRKIRYIYGPAKLEILGRSANLDVIAEKKGSTPLIGQVVLELLDLIVNPKSRKLSPNPLSPDMPRMDMRTSV